MTPQTQEAKMPIDLTDTKPQSSPIPPGIYRLRAKLMAGIAGTEHLLKRAKNGVQLMLALECTVLEEHPAYEQNREHRGRKVWDYITCELDEQGVITPLPQDKLQKLQTSVRLGRNKLRAIIDSAHKLDPNDKSEAAQAIRRRFASYADFDGIVFWAQLQERPAANGYRAGNNIDFIITPDLPDYPQEASAPPPASGSAAVAIRARYMDDEIPSEGDEG
jgi:hypothetical protein